VALRKCANGMDMDLPGGGFCCYDVKYEWRRLKVDDIVKRVGQGLVTQSYRVCIHSGGIVVRKWQNWRVILKK